MKYNIEVIKIGRKWIDVSVSGKVSNYNAQLLINEITETLTAGDKAEIECKFENKSSGYGKKYFLYPLTDEEKAAAAAAATVAAAAAEVKAEAKANDYRNRKINDYIGYVRNAAKEGRAYDNGVDKLKEWGAWTDEIKTEIKETIASAKAAKEEQKAAEDAKYANINLPAYNGFNGKPKAGVIIVQKGRVYEVVSSFYNSHDGWSFGVLNEEFYSVKAIDVTETARGAAKLAELAEREAAKVAEKAAEVAEKARIDAIIAEIKDNGERVKGDHVDMPDGEVIYDSFDNYGGGERIIKTADGAMWYIKNNGADGGDWSPNNIRTSGAGAYGWVLYPPEPVKPTKSDIFRAAHKMARELKGNDDSIDYRAQFAACLRYIYGGEKIDVKNAVKLAA